MRSERLHMGSPVAVDRVWLFAVTAWLRYHIATESFDRLLPGCWIRPDEWMPDYGARSLSTLYAAGQRKTLNARLSKADVPDAVSQSANQYVLRGSLEAQKALLAGLRGEYEDDWL